jgi:uncharacterized membrane protein
MHEPEAPAAHGKRGSRDRLRARGRPAERPGLGLVLLALSATIVLGLAAKAPCAAGSWSDGRQYRLLCYSDIVPLYSTEQLDEGKFPYLGARNEYPVGTGLLMALAAWPVDSFGGFFYANAALLSLLAAVTAVALYLMVGLRALYFAAAPTLLIYGFVNWDLLAVALATVAILAYLERRDVAAGVLLGLGAAAKLYPALLVIPFVLGRFREDEPDQGIHLAWSAAGAWLAVNLPFMVFAPRNWWEFFRFNAERTADWDSLWFSACHRLFGGGFWSPTPACGHTSLITPLSVVVFVGLAVLVYRLRAARAPKFPRWTFGFPLLILFLLTNKVYSPQYSLWLLPWFALALPDPRLWLAFEAADVLVFVTRFAWFGRHGEVDGWVSGFAIGYFEAMVVVRAIVLLFCLASWVRQPWWADAVRPTGERAAESS